LALVRPGGRIGVVLPWGLATDSGASALRHRLIGRDGLDSIVGFDNTEGIFPIHRGLRFMVMVAAPGRSAGEIRARFGVRDLQTLEDLPGRDRAGSESAFPIRLTADTLRKAGGVSLRIPDARGQRDLDLLRRAAESYPRLGDASGWSVAFGRELNATEDADAFGADGLPVLEGKHIRPFGVDVNAATKRIRLEEASRRLRGEPFLHARLGYRDVSGAGNRFALIAAIIPQGAVTTHTLYCLRNRLPMDEQHFLCGLFNSTTVNRMMRMLMGGHITTDLIESLPAPVWQATSRQRRLAKLAARVETRPGDAAALAELNAIAAAIYGEPVTDASTAAAQL
jgi:hypothetical protein